MQVVNPQLRAQLRSTSDIRTVTVLGATGSVGTSTVDLLKRGNGKYRVEAVTAHKNAAAACADRARPRTRASRSSPIRPPMAN